MFVRTPQIDITRTAQHEPCLTGWPGGHLPEPRPPHESGRKQTFREEPGRLFAPPARGRVRATPTKPWERFMDQGRRESLRMRDDLSRCKEELRALREENRHLREAADAFGALADRLNAELQEERRLRDSDRRAHARPTRDRRQRVDK